MRGTQQVDETTAMGVMLNTRPFLDLMHTC